MSTALSNLEQPPKVCCEEVRVLILQPSPDPTSEIICNLHTIVLGNDHPEPYEALSYAWEGAMVTIILDNAPVKVSENLKSALIQMRYTDQARYLWTDAISIVQTPEGIMQGVPRILGAFKQAQQVLVWLGPEKDESDRAMDHLAYLAEKQQRIDSGRALAAFRSISIFTVTSIWSLLRLCMIFLFISLWTTSGFAAILPLFFWYIGWWQNKYLRVVFCYTYIRVFKNALMSSAISGVLGWLYTAIPQPSVKVNPQPPIIPSLCRLFERKWFTRTWIIQEVVGAKAAVVVCGSRCFSWSTLVDAVDMMNMIAMSETGRSPYLDCMYKRVSSIIAATELDEMPPSVVRQRQSLLYLATTFSHYDATASQDKINGMLGLSNDKVIPFSHQDKSAVEVFTQATKNIMMTSGNLDVLRACLHKGTVQGLPSWVPDWTAKDISSVSGMAYRRDPWFLETQGPLTGEQPVATFSSDLQQMALQGVVTAKLKGRDSVWSYSSHGSSVQLSKEHALLVGWLAKDKAPDGVIPLSSEAWTAPIAIILGRSVRYSSLFLLFLSYIPGFQSLLTRAADENWWGFGFFFNAIREALSKSPASGHRSRLGVWPCSWEAMAMSLNPENCGSTFQAGWLTQVMRKGLEVDSSKSRLKILSTYAKGAEAGDLVVMFIGAKVPFIIRPMNNTPSETVESETTTTSSSSSSSSSVEPRRFHLIGPASWGGFAADTVAWKEVKEAWTKGEHMLETFVLV